MDTCTSLERAEFEPVQKKKLRLEVLHYEEKEYWFYKSHTFGRNIDFATGLYFVSGFENLPMEVGSEWFA